MFPAVRAERLLNFIDVQFSAFRPIGTGPHHRVMKENVKYRVCAICRVVLSPGRDAHDPAVMSLELQRLVLSVPL